MRNNCNIIKQATFQLGQVCDSSETTKTNDKSIESISLFDSIKPPEVSKHTDPQENAWITVSPYEEDDMPSQNPVELTPL